MLGSCLTASCTGLARRPRWTAPPLMCSPTSRTRCRAVWSRMRRYYSQRQVGIRARRVECFRAASPPRRECLEAALTLLRSWQDQGLHTSARALLDHELNRSPQGLAELRALLTA